jgi:maltose alpha-D-glucosyltransferase/alpha-amylase
MLEATTTLGRRTGQLHRALAADVENPAMTPVPLSGAELTRLATALREHATKVFDGLRTSLSRLPDDVVEPAGLVLGRRRTLIDRFDEVAALGPSAGWRTRIHGDYHLGQVLRVKNDYFILDFEGEPARPLTERRARHSPLKDVAGMVRSFSYAAWTGLFTYTKRRPEDLARLEPWARLWERSVTVAFLRGYGEATMGAPFLPEDGQTYRTLLDVYILDKVLYELAYELDNRPAWVRVPLNGILDLD